ncbi:SDR family oxidoreductase [Geomonas sp. RF6]|uniref:SDR family NAD(P)-dependent oxidoreductase n=1 Tax=Geomonas sp. RF6 TaxID=2897342 RepID=UPI001E65A4BA|nr:SDR family oxidoreductase [Geomonas sp. RF6]UFS69181.1 SDR family oxidoreductase [Geomonas sp. RF6]
MNPTRKKSRALSFLLAGTAAAVVTSAMARRLRRVSFAGASVVITGGSRGLGLELARLFADERAAVTLLARDAEALERARLDLERRGADVLALQCDVANPHEVQQAVDQIMRYRRRIDVLVNNAGIVQVAPMENLDLQDFRDAMDIYAWAPLYTVSAVAPLMRRQGGGRIVNISSIGGIVAVPHLLAYSVGKFALTGLSDGLRAELAKDGIRVTTVIPGLMRTGSHLHAFFKGQHRKEYAWFSISDAFPLFSSSSRTAARKILNACRYGDARLIISLPATLMHACNALFPGVYAGATELAARLLPAPDPAYGGVLHLGRESRSRFTPRILTSLADRAAERNNEM